LGKIGGADIFIAKYDISGSLIWVKNTGALGWESTQAITIDDAKNIYITGYYELSTVIGKDTLTGGGAQVFIAKYDTDGNPVWATGAGGAGNDVGYGIAVSNGSAIVTGGFGSASMALGSHTLSNSGNGDLFVAKLGVFGTAITEAHPNRLSIFPNPCREKLLVEGTTGAHYRVLGVSGQLLLSGTVINNSIDTKHLPAGMYYLFLGANGELGRFKFVKE
jgi:hypothetical protein